MMRSFILFFIFLITGSFGLAAELKVATLHPLLADLARQVGGDRIEVIDLIGATGDPHHFEPSTDDLKKATGARLYLVAGMGLESYLPALKTITPATSRVLEVGATLLTLDGSCNDPDHQHGDHHDHEIDPHWWHSIDRFRRATTVVAEAFAEVDPTDAAYYRQNASIYRSRLDSLEQWARVKLAAIPRDRRKLATAHSAFNYFCADFDFLPYSVQGLNREQSPDPAFLAALVADLKKNNVAALFPEKESNPKLLSVVTRDTGIKLGAPLIADGTNSPTYESMVRHNVEAIVAGLRSK